LDFKKIVAEKFKLQLYVAKLREHVLGAVCCRILKFWNKTDEKLLLKTVEP